MPIKITTKDGDIYKLRWVEEKDRKIISIKNVERKYYYKKDIFQYAILDPEPHTVPLDTALQHHGTIRLLTIVDNESHNSHEFIKISENDERITGYKITGKDSLTVVIPIDQIEKIQLKDKKKSNANTAGLFIGVGLGIALIVGIYAFGESFGGSWYD